MNKMGFAIVFILMAIVLFSAFWICVINKKSKYSNAMSKVLLTASVLNLVYGIGLLVENKLAFSIISSISSVLTVWLIYIFLFYIRSYISLGKNKTLSVIFLVLCIIDSIVLVSNIFYPWVMDYKLVKLLTGDYYIVDTKLAYAIHSFVCYLEVAFASIYAIKESRRTAKIYKGGYLVIFILILIAFILHSVYIFFPDIPVDFSVMLYGFISLATMYFTMYRTPKALERKIQALIVDSLVDIFIVFNDNGGFFYANSKAYEVFDKNDILLGYDSFSNNQIVIPRDGKQRILEKKVNNEKRYFKVSHSEFLDNQGKIQAYYFSLHDITYEMKTVAEREYNSSHDRLTGAYNRNYFLEQAKKMVDSNPDDTYYIIATNFERFRLYNDIYGTAAGDKILIKMAEVLNEISSKHKLIFARMGSDNFGICITKDVFEEIDFANYLVEKFKEHEVNHVKLKLGICPLEQRSIFKAFDRAILTIHHYKNKIDQRYAFYDIAIRNELVREGVLLKAFDESIDNRYFEMYLQPLMNSFDNTMIGAEALVRWKHPKFGMISPGEFIPVFEKSSHISRLDLYVWEEACRYIRKCIDKGINNLSISVNVSRVDFYNLDMVSELNNLVKKYDVNPSMLKLEITESAFISDHKKIVEDIIKLQNSGFIIEMDDFGSGYSSLNVLKEIPIDIVKLDMKFLSKTENERKTIEIIDSVISMAHRLNLPVIAEGVETLEQVNMLKQMNCELMQGYYYARPMPISDFEVYLENHELSLFLINWIHSDEKRNLYSIFKEIEKYYGKQPFSTMVLSPKLNEDSKIIDLQVIYQNKAFSEKENKRIGLAKGFGLKQLFNDFNEQWIEMYSSVLFDRKSINHKQIMSDGSEASLSIFPLGNTKYIVVVCIE